jgi:hypothetical protein
VFWALRSQAKSDLLHRLDADEYASSDTEVLTIPISLPYPLQDDDYKRVNGEFEYQGSYYNLVKQKLENDTLFVVCIKNHQEKKLVNKMNEYSNLMNNLPTSTKQTIDLFGKLFKDYNSIHFSCSISNEGLNLNICYTELNLALLIQDYPIDSPPPQV